MALRSFFLRANKKVEENKKSYKEKAEDTKEAYSNLHEMQKYVDLSEEKRALLMDLVLHGRSSDSNESLLEKGVLIYAEYIEVIEQLAEDFEGKGIDCSVITGKTKEADRGKISKEFKANPNSKVVLMSSAGAESLNLNASNEIFLMDLPKGPGKFNQTIGRIARCFSKFEEQNRSFYIHYVIVEETLDEYKPILLSSKKQLEEDILHADTISLKEMKSFDAMLLKDVKKRYLWKTKKRKKK
jgi:SNF2 family DNA or RNA helicase